MTMWREWEHKKIWQESVYSARFIYLFFPILTKAHKFIRSSVKKNWLLTLPEALATVEQSELASVHQQKELFHKTGKIWTSLYLLTIYAPNMQLQCYCYHSLVAELLVTSWYSLINNKLRQMFNGKFKLINFLLSLTCTSWNGSFFV